MLTRSIPRILCARWAAIPSTNPSRWFFKTRIALWGRTVLSFSKKRWNVDMSLQRVVITGLGVVAPNGLDKASYWQALIAGQNAIGPITRFDASPYSVRIAGEVKNFKSHHRIPQDHLKHMDRSYQMGVTAAFQAVEDAKIDLSSAEVNRWGVYMGLAVAGVDMY